MSAVGQETIVLRAARAEENTRRYSEIQDFIRRNALTYQSLGEAIGYSVPVLRQYMSKLKNGKNASRYIWASIKKYAEDIAYERYKSQQNELS